MIRPVLLIHPDSDEADYLVRRLKAEGVDRPVVMFCDADEGRDYLETVLLAEADRYRPCAILLDQKLGEEPVRAFTDWVRTVPSLAAVRIATLTSAAKTDEAAWGADQAVRSTGALQSLSALLSRACGS